jgi:hypothetical protein
MNFIINLRERASCTYVARMGDKRDSGWKEDNAVEMKIPLQRPTIREVDAFLESRSLTFSMLLTTYIGLKLVLLYHNHPIKLVRFVSVYFRRDFICEKE